MPKRIPVLRSRSGAGCADVPSGMGRVISPERKSHVCLLSVSTV